MSEDNPKFFSSISEWHDWLKKYHTFEKKIWLIIQKKGSKNLGVRYEEVVLEAIAHGWVDGKMKRLNDDEFMQRFTPRRSDSLWSMSNRKRVERLISEGRMTPAGLKKVEEAKKKGIWDKAYSSRDVINVPDDLIESFKKNKTANENFESFPPYARFMYIHWINEAKQLDTRNRRIKTVVLRSEKNLKPGIDLRVAKE